MFNKETDKQTPLPQATPNVVHSDDAAVPFRDRIAARHDVRPQSTLGIVAGIDGDAETTEARRRNRGAYHATAASTGALGAGGFDETHSRGRRSGGSGDGGGGGADHSDDDSGSRLGDISQFAFAGLAVLGLAGLSVLAAETALKGPENGKTPGTGPDTTGAAGAATVASTGAPQETSTAALTTAATPAATPTPWFDYRGAADMLAKRQAELNVQRAAAAKVEADATAVAEANAATAIADAEAKRLADEAVLAASATDQAKAADVAEAKRLADIEADRVAALEADRLAQQQADATAAAEIEAARLADLETKRMAAAEAETKRLAEAAAERKAKAAAEVKRLAAIEKSNADAAAKKLAADKAAADKAEAVRLAKVEADRVAGVETARLAKAAADREAKLVAARASSPRAAPAPIVFAAYTGRIPAPASMKPPKPRVTLTSASSTTTRMPTRRVVSSTPASTYAGTRTSVRPSGPRIPRRMATPAPNTQTVDDFLASRVQRTATRSVSDAQLVSLKAQFLDMVENEVDGARRTLITPDGREVNVYMESTRPVEAVTKTIRTIDYSTVSNTDTSRFSGNVTPVKVSVMCRDVSYAFPGQERGRFAACERADGGWMLARASDPGARPT